MEHVRHNFSERRIILMGFAGLFMLSLLLPVNLQAQEHYVEFYGKSLEMNNRGMAVLGSWALANISVGTYGWIKQTGQRAYFHQMNLFWNTVNLSIAGIALYSNLSTDFDLLSAEEMLEKQLKTQRIFLINAGLDVGYVATGFILKHLADRYPNNELRLIGYGNSVIMQGTFLFVFDTVLYLIQRNHRMGFLDQIAFSPLQDAWGVALTVNL